jgi:hypothetical protein
MALHLWSTWLENLKPFDGKNSFSQDWGFLFPWRYLHAFTGAGRSSLLHDDAMIWYHW